MLTALRVPQAPNHFIENGIVFKGDRQRKIIKPNNKGVYKLTYKGDTILINEKLIMSQKPDRKTHTRKHRKNVKIKYDNRTRFIKKECVSLNLNPNSYKSWLYSNGSKISQFTTKEHANKILEFGEYIKGRRRTSKNEQVTIDIKYSSVSALCFYYNMDYNYYKGYFNRTYKSPFASKTMFEHEEIILDILMSK